MTRVYLVLKIAATAAPFLMHAGIAHAQAHDQDAGSALLLLVLLIIAAIYVLPTIVAFAREHPNRWLILVINVLFGGTGLGWLGSLVWACSAVHRSPSGNPRW